MFLIAIKYTMGIPFFSPTTGLTCFNFLEWFINQPKELSSTVASIVHCFSLNLNSSIKLPQPNFPYFFCLSCIILYEQRNPLYSQINYPYLIFLLQT